MQLVINIDEEVYKRVLPYKDVPVISNPADDISELIHAIVNSTPLPKGHGRLIDADKAILKLCGSTCGCRLEECGFSKPCYSVGTLIVAPTIVKADRSVEE